MTILEISLNPRRNGSYYPLYTIRYFISHLFIRIIENTSRKKSDAATQSHGYYATCLCIERKGCISKSSRINSEQCSLLSAIGFSSMPMNGGVTHVCFGRLLWNSQKEFRISTLLLFMNRREVLLFLSGVIGANAGCSALDNPRIITIEITNQTNEQQGFIITI